MKDPERYLDFVTKLDCPVRLNHRAVIDSAHRAYVNHEIYYLSDGRSLERFRKEPQRYCGLVTDPVTRVRFRPSRSSPRWDYRGRPYFFTKDSALTVFQAMPDSFAVRKGM